MDRIHGCSESSTAVPILEDVLAVAGGADVADTLAVAGGAVRHGPLAVAGRADGAGILAVAGGAVGAGISPVQGAGCAWVAPAEGKPFLHLHAENPPSTTSAKIPRAIQRPIKMPSLSSMSPCSHCGRFL